jgi:hypothetical protein
MSTGIKIALIGCGLLFVIVIVGFGVGGYLLKKYVGEGVETVKNVVGSEDSEYGKKMAELAQEYPFTPPSDGVITDNQLQRFLNVRKSLFSIYKNHESEFAKLKDSQNPDLGSAMKGFSMMKELRVAQAKALEEQHMSLEEYRFMVTTVYVTWATKATKEVAPMMNSTAEGLKKSIEEIDKQLADSNIPETAKEQLRQTKESMQSQLDSIPKEIDKQLEGLPQANIDLLTRYQKEVEKYYMAGLEYIGF